jgi:carbonic anhydrase/acetyltransferase-like protein (isoleucine patch superfamily)
VDVAASARLIGEGLAGEGSLLAQGTVLRAEGPCEVGGRTMVLENGVIIATEAHPVRIGTWTVFGHRCLVVGAEVGDLCEIGNGAILMPGARLGDGCILGEGCLVPEGTALAPGTVAVGRPARKVRDASAEDRARILALRGGSVSTAAMPLHPFRGEGRAGATMGQLYAYGDKAPRIDPSAVLFDSAELTGDVTVGPGTIIGAGVKIIGDSHGPVRIGARVQILENAVLHLLPDNALVIEDDVVIGPGCMIHGCRLGVGTVVEPGAQIADWSELGPGCLVKAGAVVKQRSRFEAGCILDGFPAKVVGMLEGPPGRPGWAFRPERLPVRI